MLRMTSRGSSSPSNVLLNYLSERGKARGTWGGDAASSLGLTGGVSADAFGALYDNLHPVSRERLTVRTKENRTVGYDLNFNAPKSVSLLLLLTGDDRVRGAFERSVDETMREIEKAASTRVRVGGQDTERPTGSLAWARFTHLSGRPVAGVPDPQLHAHCFVFNATFDSVEARWKAGQFREIKAAMPYSQTVFHNRLAGRLMELGYRVRGRGLSFEVEGVPDELIARFSRRTRAIERAAEELGITDERRKATLGARTREAKQPEMTDEDFIAQFHTRLTPEERGLGARLVAERGVARAVVRPEGIHERAVEYAIRWCFERESVVPELDLVNVAMRHRIGMVEPLRLMEIVASHPDLIRRFKGGRNLVTTKTVLAEEKAVIDWVKAGHGTMQPLATSARFSREMADDHRQAAMHILTSTDRVTGVNGKAGTGKTTMMNETIDNIRRAGHKVIVMAPTAQTGRGILREQGFEDADTVHKLFWTPSSQEEARGGVWWVDEAGLMSIQNMHDLVQLAEQLDARLILSGDTGQHRSVQRGDALRILLNHAAVKLATLAGIRRQKGEYRTLVEHFAEGRLKEAFDQLDAMGALVEMPGSERHEYLAAEYLKVIKSGKTALIVSPTHSEGRKVTGLVRASLKAEGAIRDERELDILRKIDLREVDQEDPRTYRTGWVLDVFKAFKGFAAGRQYEIVEVNEDGVFARHPDGSSRWVDVARFGGRVRVYEREVLAVGVGDRIRVTRNGKDALGVSPVNNGSLHTVTGFTKDGDLVLDHGVTLSRRYRFLAHGYVTTSYAAQGKTVDWVFIAQSTESFPATHLQQAYVSASRGREGIVWLTDDKEGLMRAASVSADRTAALDIAGDWREELTMAQRRAEPQTRGVLVLPMRDHLGTLRTPLPIVVVPTRERPAEAEIIVPKMP
jgi:conjugative relaxase-like TrwC/TraI family protein